ncbi:anaerobic ribonucleoside-triphosphate reductase activating protein [Prolixibacteraceae bacterium JC049]|nr:anaerobic ribonucleoside-triphosphate reductase activating protein [Prolixibacteraceae bacterium JC049]
MQFLLSIHSKRRIMNISGFVKSSLIDYPGYISSVIFTQGCNFKCPFCHNPDLIPMQTTSCYPESVIFDYLDRYRKMIDAVVISGGEPCLQADLIDFCTLLKEKGFKIKLDTNGAFPIVVQKLIARNLVDYIAMDIKAPLNQQDYSELIGCKKTPLESIKQTIQTIIDSSIHHEFRSTIIKEKHSANDLVSMTQAVTGCERFMGQHFSPQQVLDPAYKMLNAYTNKELSEIISTYNLEEKIQLR